LDDLLSLLVIVFTVISLVNKGKKKTTGKQTGRPKWSPPEPMPESAPQAVPKRPAAAPAVTMMPPRPEYQPITPLEAMAAQAAVRTKEGASSLEGKTDHSAHISCEGHDPCHEDQLRPAQRPSRIAMQETMSAAAEEEAPALDLSFTGDELVRAFVMQEILTRPCERKHQTV